MNIDILTPEKKLYTGTVKSVSVPGIEGDFQILDNHAPIVSTLKAGKIKLDTPQNDTSNFEKSNDNLFEICIEGGIIEMNKDKIIILAE